MMLGLHQAVKDSDLPEEAKNEAFEKIGKLYSGFVQKIVTEEELSAVLQRIPRDPQGAPKKPPWTEAELQAALAQVDAVIADKQIEVQKGPPDFAEDLRRAVRNMKEVMGEAPAQPAPAAGP